MTVGVSSEILVRTTTPAGSAEVLDYQWDAGAKIVDFTSDVLIRLRLWPLKLKTRGWIEPGQESAFGPLMMMPANVPTYARGMDVGENVRAVVCKFDRQWISDMAERKSDWSHADPSACLNLRELNIEHGMLRLGAEMLEPGTASGALIDALTVSIGIELSRFLMEQNGAVVLKGSLTKARLQHIQEFIRSFSDGSPTLADVAAECGFSVAHLRRVFKSTTGKTVHDYIEAVRIERAQQLLRESNLRLKAISYQLGFSHPSAFSFAFKKAVGESPRDYRTRFGIICVEGEG